MEAGLRRGKSVVIFVGAAVVILLGLYLAFLVYDVKHDVKNAPREPMFVCDQHGAFPMKYVINLEGITEKPIQRCPFCFEDSFKKAKEKYKV